MEEANLRRLYTILFQSKTMEAVKRSGVSTAGQGWWGVKDKSSQDFSSKLYDIMIDMSYTCDIKSEHYGKLWTLGNYVVSLYAYHL